MEKPPSQEKDPLHTEIERQIKEWKQSPTILASGSKFRLEQLEDYGFDDVTPAADISESVEIKAADKMKSGGALKTHFDGDGRNFSEHIAAAKVQHVIEAQAPNPDTVIIGFDTTAVLYDQPTDEQYMGVPVSAEKYETVEAARAGILRQFLILSEGCIEHKKKIEKLKKTQEQIGGTDEDIATALAGHELGTRRGKIYINTGVALTTPNTHDTINRFTEEIQLYSEAIAATAGNEQALEHLVDQVLEHMGDSITEISGGINYADSYIRDILQIREITFKDIASEENIYKGFPAQALTATLRMRARRNLTEKT